MNEICSNDTTGDKVIFFRHFHTFTRHHLQHPVIDEWRSRGIDKLYEVRM